MTSQPGRVGDNLERASRFVATAAERGASIVLFPDFMPSGYRLTRDLWTGAETREGPTVTWLRTQSAAHRIMIGTSFIEARGEDFHDTFALADDRGQIIARVRKSWPAAVESFFIRGGDDARVIDTAHGRIGIAIGYESLQAPVMQSLHGGAPDLVLVPNCAPTPNVSRGFGTRDAVLFETTLRELTHTVAAELGVPVVMANQSGPWNTPMPLFPAAQSRFSGASAIADGDGAIRAELDDDQDVLVADVAMDPSRRRKVRRESQGRWARDVPWFAKLWSATEQVGRASYLVSRTRRRTALAISRVRQ